MLLCLPPAPCLCRCLAAWAQNTIQSITSSQQAGTEVVRVELSEPLAAVPNGFSVQAPPRIAIDLPGVSNGLGRSSIDINQGNLRSANVAQAGDRTRLVLNLKAGIGLPRAGARQGAAADPGYCGGQMFPPSLAPPRAGGEQAGAPSQHGAEHGVAGPCATSTSAVARTAPAASSSTCPAAKWG